MINRLLVWPSTYPARAGAVAGWFQQGCGMLVALLLIPVVTRFMAPDQAGIWFAFQGLVSMISLLDLGFGFAISRQAAFTIGATEATVAKHDFIHLAHGWSGVAQLFLLTRTLYRWLAFMAALTAVFAFEVVTRVGNLVPPGTAGVRWCWYGMALASCILILTAGRSAFLNGLGAVYQTRFLAGIYQLAAGGGAAFAAWKGWGLPAMGISFAFCAVFYRFGVGIVSQSVTSSMREAPHIPPPEGSLKRLARAALPIGGVTIFGSLIYTIQAPLLGILLGPEKVAPFYLAQKIASSINVANMQTGLPYLPFFTRLLGQGQTKEAKNLMRNVTFRITAFALVGSVIFFFVSPLAASFLLKSGSYLDRSILGLIALDMFLLSSTVIWSQFVLAAGRNPFLIQTLATGITSLVASIVFVNEFGVFGLPLATITAGCMFNYRKYLFEGRALWKRLSV